MNRELLEKPFAPDQIKQRDGNFGKTLDYVEGHAIIQRLNDAFDAKWSFEILKHEVFEDKDEVIVQGKLTAESVVKTQFGSSQITRAKETGEIISLADDLKAAATDSLKKCATMLGVGLHLYNGDSSLNDRNRQNRSGNNNSGQKNNQRKGNGGECGNGGNGDSARITSKQLNYIVNLGGNLNEDGYLDIQLEQISQTFRCSEEMVFEALHFVQHFDPVGAAAQDTQECLLIQARFQNFGGTIVEKIIMDHLGDLENRKFDTIAKRLSVPIEQVITAVSILQGLELKPGRGYSDDETIYVTPDIYIFKVGDDYEIVQNEDGLPKLRSNCEVQSHNY